MSICGIAAVFYIILLIVGNVGISDDSTNSSDDVTAATALVTYAQVVKTGVARTATLKATQHAKNDRGKKNGSSS